jgi:hypothetical protein
MARFRIATYSERMDSTEFPMSGSGMKRSDIGHALLIGIFSWISYTTYRYTIVFYNNMHYFLFVNDPKNWQSITDNYPSSDRYVGYLVRAFLGCYAHRPEK